MATLQRTHSKPPKIWSYLMGVASIFDFQGVLNRPRKPLELPSVYEALRSDWQSVGQDIARAMRRFASQYPEVRK